MCTDCRCCALLESTYSRYTQSAISSELSLFFLVVTNPAATSSFQDLLKAMSWRPPLCFRLKAHHRPAGEGEAAGHAGGERKGDEGFAAEIF
jgi:hypothetical protein